MALVENVGKFNVPTCPIKVAAKTDSAIPVSTQRQAIVNVSIEHGYHNQWYNQRCFPKKSAVVQSYQGLGN